MDLSATTKRAEVQAKNPCPCGNTLEFESCCQPIHKSGAGLGITAEVLMRARYSAYVIGNEQFLLESWHPDTRPEAIKFDSGIQWSGLTIHQSIDGGGLDADGTVEFTAQFKTVDGQNQQLHEVSSFVRQGGNWVYVDGKVDPSANSDS